MVILSQLSATGSEFFKNENRLSANPNGHRPSCFSDEEQKQLGELLESDVDITLSEIKQHFGKDCSLTAIHYHVVKAKVTFIKTLKASEQEREDVKGKSWVDKISKILLQ